MNVQDEPLDLEALQTLAHLTAQTAGELKNIDALTVGSSQNMKGLQYDPHRIIKENFLPRVQRNGAPRVPVNIQPAQPQPVPQPYPQQAFPVDPPPQKQPAPQPRPPFQAVPQPAPQPVQSVLSDAQISLLVEKILRLERMLERAIENQESLQNTLDKSLDKLLKKKLKDVKITFKDDDTHDSE